MPQQIRKKADATRANRVMANNRSLASYCRAKHYYIDDLGTWMISTNQSSLSALDSLTVGCEQLGSCERMYNYRKQVKIMGYDHVMLVFASHGQYWCDKRKLP
uniref:Uncharacterized protein n=1 Tax=Salix viminalis TaxID=40686 RepID=A0A6N2L7X4_SALVM